MKARHKRGLFLMMTLFIVTFGVALFFANMGQYMQYFYTPRQLLLAENLQQIIVDKQVIRLGGLVEDVKANPETNEYEFGLSDGDHLYIVKYKGILPDLFREGQGMVAIGTLGRDDIFYADKLLAKHDENYMPPELKNNLKPGYGETQK